MSEYLHWKTTHLHVDYKNRLGTMMKNLRASCGKSQYIPINSFKKNIYWKHYICNTQKTDVCIQYGQSQEVSITKLWNCFRGVQ